MKVIKHDRLDKGFVPFENLNIYLLSDVHWEDSLCNRKKLFQWRDEVLSAENNFVIINGDIINAATRNSVSDVYSSKASPDRALDEVSDFIRPLVDANRVLAIIDGNHEKRVAKESGIKLMKRLSRELGIEELYAEEAYMLFLSFGQSQGRDCRQMVYSVYGRHGSGGGKKAGGKVNSLSDMQLVIDADIYVMGHTHMPVIFPSTYYRVNYRNRKVTPVEKMFVNTNAFLDYGSYGEEQGFSPTAIRWPVVILSGKERHISAKI